MNVRLLPLVVATLAVGCYDGPEDAGEPWAGDGSTGTIPAGDSSSGPASSDGSGSSASSTQGSGSASDSDDGSDSSDPSGDSSDPTGDGSSGGDDSSGGETGENPVPEGVSPEEAELVDLINAYRADNGLPAIPHCPSLALVARTHCVDLAEEAPHTTGSCNLHSWSDAGSWSACCYTPDHAQAQCMWDKPRELTDYPGNGYEISVGGGGSITPQGALAAWQGSPGHNNVILNQDIWADSPWGCIGAGIYMGYSHVWFGEESDPAL